MEPITLTAAVGTAIVTTLATKALEKTGEKIGEQVFDATGKFLSQLRSKSPDTATAIELAEQQPLDYGKAVLEVQEAAKDPEVAQAIWDVEAAAANEDPNSKLAQEIQKQEDTLKSQCPTIYNLAKLQEKGVINQSTVQQQTNNF
ncbi:MAG TPA: hypothetical protein DCE56_10030 [Cyanobacteria bacterium UBA8553]|nr:hypothetical protein [Cyanobacteria bacterium UBA8553]HAJ61590.1 hypothetical protein [Cyanobacteria bacterium UBA8543]